MKYQNAFEHIVNLRTSLAGKAIAVVTAGVMALSLGMGSLPAYAAEVGQAYDNEPIFVGDPDSVALVAFDTFEAYALVNGQPVVESLLVPAGRDFTFGVQSNEGFEVARISAHTAEGVGVSVYANGDGTYTLAAQEVAGSVVVVIDSTTSTYRPPVVPDPIVDDGVVDDGGTSVEVPGPDDPNNPEDPGQPVVPDPGPDDPNFPEQPSTFDGPVYITCGHATKTYDGTPLTADAAMVEVAGLPVGYSATIQVQGSQTKVGQSETTVASYTFYDDQGVDVTSSFTNVNLQAGVLLVEEYAGEVVITTTGGTYTYDTTTHTPSVTVSGIPAGYTVERAASRTQVTNATVDDPVAVTCDDLLIRNAQGDDVTERLNRHYIDGYITVYPLRLMVTTPSAAKSYDGTPLTATIDAASAVQAIDYRTGMPVQPAWLPAIQSFSVRGVQTDVGASYNPFDITLVAPGNPSDSVAFTEFIGTLDLVQDPGLPASAAESTITIIGATWETMENYDVIGNYGVLSVTPNDGSVHLIAPSARKTYDGSPLTPPAGAQVAGLPEGFSVSVEVSGSQTDAGMSATKVAAYSIFDPSGRDVTNTFANVVTTDGVLTVEPATIVVTTPSASKGYDGSPLTAASDGWISGFVAGETAQASITGSQTEVGASRNYYEIVWNGSAKQGNYVVQEHLGTLRVAPRVTAGTAVNPLGSTGSTGVLTGVGGTTILSGPGANAASSNQATGSGGASSSSGSEASADADDGAGDGSINPLVSALATGMQNAAQILSGEQPTQLNAPAVNGQAGPSTTNLPEEELLDDGTPLGAFDEPVQSWVHWYQILGIILTLLAGLFMIVRRLGTIGNLKSIESQALGQDQAQPDADLTSANQAAFAGKEA